MKVEVVLCKDCVYSGYDGRVCRYSVGRPTDPDGYCHHGRAGDNYVGLTD